MVETCLGMPWQCWWAYHTEVSILYITYECDKTNSQRFASFGEKRKANCEKA